MQEAPPSSAHHETLSEEDFPLTSDRRRPREKTSVSNCVMPRFASCSTIVFVSLFLFISGSSCYALSLTSSASLSSSRLSSKALSSLLLAPMDFSPPWMEAAPVVWKHQLATLHMKVSGRMPVTHMFLPTQKLSAVALSRSDCAGTRHYRSSEELKDEHLQLCRRGPRGTLGFEVCESTALEASRSSVDSHQWNVPQTWNALTPSGRGNRIWGSDSATWSGAVADSAAAPPLSSTTLWLPWIPTRQQIEDLKVVELKQVCAERGLLRTGNKAILQTRLLDWTREQITRNVQMSSSGLSFLDTSEPVLEEEGREMRPSDQPTMQANSLAEWARTVDLEPLLQRRETIHREKLEGKPILKPSRQTQTVNMPRQEYLSVLTRVFEKPSSPYSNREVKQMYAASKQADQVGDRDLAKRLLQELVVATPHDARLYRRLARMYKEEGNVSAARAILQQGIRDHHAKNGYLWHGLGSMATSDADAKHYWQKAIEVDPALPHPYHSLGTLEHKEGRIANAMKTLQKGVAYCPTSHRLHHALGELYRDAKMLDMAAKSYHRAIQHGPPVSHGFAFTGLAYVAYEQDDIHGARRWLRKAIVLNKGRHVNSWVALAQMEESIGDIDSARATCVAGLAQYERGLLQRSNRGRPWKPTTERAFLEDPVALKDEFLRQVPVYRSGDRFFNLYRNWARLEERYGNRDSVKEVYRRATVAFPNEYRLLLDWAQYMVKEQRDETARQLFAKASTKAASKHADPHRVYAEFEMSRGRYLDAREILYRGAMVLSKTTDSGGSAGNRYGLAELFHTWAVCEWHLNELSRSESLFDHALRMTNAGEDGSKLRSLILYSMARLQYYRGEHLLAQHCIGLCLKENLMPGGNSKIWDLWSDVATQMGNPSLSQRCQEQSEASKSNENANGTTELSGLLEHPSGLTRMKGPDMEQLMRRDPWHRKIFGTPLRPTASLGVNLPEVL